MKKILTGDDVLPDKFKSAKRGLKLWKAVNKEMDVRPEDILIIQPDGYNQEAVFSLTCLPLLLMTQYVRRVCIVTTNPDMERYVRLFCNHESAVTAISDEEACDLMNYALMTVFPPNNYIASFSKPYGRWGEKMIENGKVGPEHCFAIGIYRVWRYKSPPIPKYKGRDKIVYDFLKKARQLQNESIKIDAESGCI